ncbi:thiol-disulfide oxidoreductase DCC family protein [Kribbella deserti]|uniref:Thiol-disulfide oxidoreductase DCC family protein n=1 Tax=Kribbella deserti TaxID=1926257 RepID=A0ABV6QNI8_9ACTN
MPEPVETKSLPILIFDGDCGFCTTSARWLQRRLRSDVAVEPWQFTDLVAYGTTPQRATYEVIWADADGELYGGAQAFARWLIHTGGLWSVPGAALTLPPIRWLAAGVYRLIANNRQRMPGGTPACALPQPPKP